MKDHKNRLTMILVLLAMLVILVLWFLLSPPDYFKKKNGQGFDSLKGEFSNILKG